MTAKWQKKNATIPVLDKIDFKDERITTDKKCLIIKEVSIHQDNIVVLSLYELNNINSKYIKQTLTEL